MKSINCSTKISNIHYNLIYTTIISCDYSNLSFASQYVDDITIPSQVIEYNQNFYQVDQPIGLQYSNLIKLLFLFFFFLELSRLVKYFPIDWRFIWFMVFNATFNNIFGKSWRSVLLVEETGVPEENHRPVASNFSCDRHWLHKFYSWNLFVSINRNLQQFVSYISWLPNIYRTVH